MIVPVYNDQEHIGGLIESLLGQDYPSELIEIIIVDNNSTDGTRQIVERYPVRLLQENAIQSSYAARNTGIKAARGEIFAFIDSDCTAEVSWVKEGLAALEAQSADLVGGKVEFVFSEKKTTAEIYDSITHFHFESTIKEQKGTGAGNLFVRRSVFESIGMFPDNVKSGGDFQWTSRAVNSGYRLAYAPAALVKHPARPLKELLKKRYRLGPGIMQAQVSQGKSLGRILTPLLLTFLLPVPPAVITKAIKRSKNPQLKKKFFGLWMTAWLCKLAGRTGVIMELLGLTKK